MLSPKDVVRKFVTLLNGEPIAIEDVLSADFVMRGPLISGQLGRDDIAHAIAELRGSFADIHYEIEELVTEGTRVAARYSVSGSQRADYHGIKSLGRSFTMAAVSIYTVIDGRIAEEWELVDRASLLNQLGSEEL